MSRIRTGLSPDAWLDEGPSVAQIRAGWRPGGQIVTASKPPPSMTIHTPGELARKRRRAEELKAARQVCDAFMPMYGERCGRTPGHAYAHRTRAAMDNNANTQAAAG